MDPALVPAVLAAAPGRLLLADAPGTDGWDASPAVVAAALGRPAAAQARVDPPAVRAPDPA